MPGRPGISGPSMPPPSGGSATGIGWVSRSRNNCPAAVADVDTAHQVIEQVARFAVTLVGEVAGRRQHGGRDEPRRERRGLELCERRRRVGAEEVDHRVRPQRLTVDEPGDGVGEHRVVDGWSEGPRPAVGKTQPSRPGRPVGRLLVELGAKTGGRRAHGQSAAAVHVERGERRRRYGVRQQVDRSGIKHDHSLDGPARGLRSAATLGSTGGPA